MYTSFNIDINNSLTQEHFSFMVIENKISLQYYSLREKDTLKKRTFKPKYWWQRIDKRKNNINYEEIPLTKEIKEQALEKARAMITFE